MAPLPTSAGPEVRPPTRGPRTGARPAATRRRFIPTVSGQHKLTASRNTRIAGSPRVGGEHYGVYPLPYSKDGSPLRRQGPHRQHHGEPAHGWFTPASARITAAMSQRGPATPSHPRVSGDQVSSKLAARERCSPLRRQGAPGRSQIPGGRGRLTPAPARSTRPDAPCEHVLVPYENGRMFGSPSCRRGRLRKGHHHRDRHGFTPASAGSTRWP